MHVCMGNKCRYICLIYETCTDIEMDYLSLSVKCGAHAQNYPKYMHFVYLFYYLTYKNNNKRPTGFHSYMR